MITDAASMVIGNVIDAAALVALTEVAAVVIEVTSVRSQEKAPAADVLPAGQLEHALELVPPVLERYRPAMHAVQLVEVWALDD